MLKIAHVDWYHTVGSLVIWQWTPDTAVHLSHTITHHVCLSKRLFTHAANYVYTIIVIMYRLDANAANRWLLTNAAKRTSLTILCFFFF